MESVEKKLEREQSVGNRIYRTITPEWFEANHDWIDKFLDNANDPELLDEVSLCNLSFCTFPYVMDPAWTSACH